LQIPIAAGKYFRPRCPKVCNGKCTRSCSTLGGRSMQPWR